MSRLTKLIILIILSLSVYFIYIGTNNSKYQITNIGDKLSQGINSFGIKELSYVDYYKDYLLKDKKEIIINNTYSKKDQSINKVLTEIKCSPEIKKVLSESNEVILTIGYNDLLYGLSIEENKNLYSLDKIVKNIEKEYNDLITEINKYYHKKVIVIGYFKSNQDDYYINKGILELNNILKENKNVIYIDTYDLSNNRTKYFSNPNSYYPNREGYHEISRKIIKKKIDYE